MIYIFLANGFEEVEALATVDVLRRADLKVKIVGVGSDVITGAHGISTVCDAVDSDLTPGDDIEAVILPGGMPGTLNLERSAKVNAFVDYAYENQKIVCDVCAAPSILGHKGMLKGKKAVCFLHKSLPPFRNPFRPYDGGARRRDSCSPAGECF